MSFRELQSVVLLHDLPERGLQAGDLGAVVLVHPTGDIEVEFVRASGHTQALLTLGPSDVRLATDDDVLSVRHAAG